jgi:hypothetical protein
MPLIIFRSKFEEKITIAEVNREKRRNRTKVEIRGKLKSEG